MKQLNSKNKLKLALELTDSKGLSRLGSFTLIHRLLWKLHYEVQLPYFASFKYNFCFNFLLLCAIQLLLSVVFDLIGFKKDETNIELLFSAIDILFMCIVLPTLLALYLRHIKQKYKFPDWKDI